MPITSKPSGAAVTLVDDSGRSIVLGPTPISVSLDPARAYDVAFALPDHATRIEHVAPRDGAALAVELAATPPAKRQRPRRVAVAKPHATARRR
jgi:hypothetical protein